MKKKESGEAMVASPPGGESRPRSGGVPSTPAEVLLAAAELVERGWTQGALARKADGTRVPIYSRHAVSFCAIGAISRVAKRGVDHNRDDAALALSRVTRGTRGRLISEWNDAPNQTAANVAATMRRVARELQRDAHHAATPKATDPARRKRNPDRPS